MKKSSYYKYLKKKISSKSFNLGVVGLGYVGLPLLLAFAKKNIKIVGIDNDIMKINKLNNGLSYIKNIDKKEIINNKKKNSI